MLKTTMSAGYVWRVVEEERAPDLDAFDPNDLIEIADANGLSAMAEETGMAWSATAMALVAPSIVEGEVSRARGFVSRSASARCAFLAGLLEGTSGTPLDHDATNS